MGKGWEEDICEMPIIAYFYALQKTKWKQIKDGVSRKTA